MFANFKAGDLAIYFNGNCASIVKIKRLVDDGAFVFTSEGDTAAKCPYMFLYHIQNEYVINGTTLGGDWNG